MYELLKLLEGFYKKNKKLVLYSVLFQVLHSVLETVIIPFIIAGAFNNIGNSEMFKMQLLKLVGLWILVKIIDCLSMYHHNQIEPEISKYIIIEIIESIFKKYENENHIVNISVLIDKIHLIKNNIHDFTHIIFTAFIPRIIVLFISFLTFLKINKKLGVVIICCVAIQYFSITRDLEKCVNITYDEYTEKNTMYEYIEDLFSNISTVQSTLNGYSHEMKKLIHITHHIRKKEEDTNNCINKKQYLGQATNIAIFSYIFYTLYDLHKKGEISNNDTTTSVLLIIGLFDNMTNITYYIPEFTHRFGVLKSNESFLKELILKPLKERMNLTHLVDTTIDFVNVSFKYPTSDLYILKDFSMTIPENKIISIYGKSGRGKTTFIKLIFGIAKPTDGFITIGGKDIRDYKIRDIRKYISYIDQNTSNLFNRSIIDNILYGKEYSDDEIVNARNHIIEIFLKFNLYEIFKNLDNGKEQWTFLEQKVGKLGDKLSGGQKKIIHLLRLEMNEFAKIIILDEPSNGLDINTRDNVVEYVKYLNSQGKTIIIISHDDYFKTISDKIIEFGDNSNPTYIK